MNKCYNCFMVKNNSVINKKIRFLNLVHQYK